MPRLSLYLFGHPRLQLDSAPVATDRRKVVALLAYLAVTRRRHSREALAALLWPDYDPSHAFAYLRRSLWEINQVAGAGWVLAERETVGLNPQADLWLDVVRFRALLAQARQGQSGCVGLPPLAEAVALYQEPFCAGFNLKDAPEFDEWVFFEAEALRRDLAGALERLIGCHLEQGQAEGAIPYARRLLALDPLNEAAHRHLMRAYAAAGQHSAALRQYQECVRLLQAELGSTPQPETSAVYAQIQSGASEDHLATAPAVTEWLPRRHPPVFATPFIGRVPELEEIASLLANPACRLLTLVAPGGTGKTRLAQQAAEANAPAFSNGMCFVPLAAQNSAEFLVPAIGSGLEYRFAGPADPKEQLLHYLCDQHLLLVLDNFEHLLDGAGLVSEILAGSPGVKVLATSRERLNLQQEWVFEVLGMSYPQPDQVSRGPLESYSAIQLFVQSARRARTGFALSEPDVPSVVRICALVAGLPLALELAATWVRTLSCAEIAQEIERDLGFLTTSQRDIPERHRSLRAVFDHSWRLLSEDEQRVLRRLAVFRGGFGREAAEQVTGASLPSLAALLDKSFMSRNAAGRYDLHVLIRQYVGEQLMEAGEVKPIRRQHLAYYLHLAEQAEPELRGPKSITWLDQLETENANLRAALEWSLEDPASTEAGLRLARALSWFWWLRSYYGEGRGWLARLLAAGAAAPGMRLARAGALHWAGSLAYIQGDTTQAVALSEQSLELAQALGDKRSMAYALCTLGAVSALHADYEKAGQLSEASLALFRELDDNPGLLHASAGTALSAWAQGDLARAARLFRNMLALARDLGDKDGAAFASLYLGAWAARQGDLEAAQPLLSDSLTLFREVGNKFFWAALTVLGSVALHQGQSQQAAVKLRESLIHQKQVGAYGGVAETLECLALVAETEGRRPGNRQALMRAARLFGAAQVLAETSAGPVAFFDRVEFQRSIDALRTALGEGVFAAAWAEGRAMPVEQAIAYALAD